MGAVVSRGQDDAGVWGREAVLSVVVGEAVQAVHAVGHAWNSVTLKQQLRHHLATVQRVARGLRQHNGVLHAALDTTG